MFRNAGAARVAVGLTLTFALLGCSASEPEARADREMSPFNPSDWPAAEGKTVTSDRAAYGDWTLKTVAGQAPPDDVGLGLRLSGSAHAGRGSRSYASWEEGPNSVVASWHVDPQGRYQGSGSQTTLVGCSSCVASGYGVQTASELRITSDGELLFVDTYGHELAAYVRTPQP